LCSNAGETNSHWGSAARAFDVRQTPPFAFAIQSVQVASEQLGAMTASIVRPPKFFVPAL
jgi:hypothetical protein